MATLHEKLAKVKTPAYVLDEKALENNMQKVARIRKEAGVKIILATKAFSMFQAFPMMRDSLDGTTASGYFEARLGAEEFGKEVHVYSPAFDDEEMEKVIRIADHITFNSVTQLNKYYDKIKAAKKPISVGLRINPQFSLAGTDIYNPCAENSRMGTLRTNVDAATLAKLDGFHFHVLCENKHMDSIALIDFIEKNYGEWLQNAKWVNFGGGHFLNHPEYNTEKLIERLKNFRAKFPKLEVILEPGGGIVYDTGYLATNVLDIVENGKKIAILNTSATTHMPDVLEMPYRPPVYGSGKPGEKKFTYLLTGKTCLTGDIIGEYSFDEELKPGSPVTFTEMMQYTMVKNTTFNGMPLPDLGLLRRDGSYEVLKKFGYEDFKGRLGDTAKAAGSSDDKKISAIVR